MARNVAKVRLAARDIAACIRPVFETREGSGRRRHIGSSFVLRAGDRAAFVTAAHVVDGPTRKTVVLDEAGRVQHWPSPYGVLVPLTDGVPDADVAYMTGTFTEDAAALRTIGLDRLALHLAVQPDMSFVAIGYPASRTRIIDGNKGLRPVTFTAVSSPAAPDVFAGEGLDPRVHLAMKYDPSQMIGLDGKRMSGPALTGMSGGGLFVVAASESSDGVSLTLLLAGILRGYRPDAQIAVATRIDCLLDAVSPQRAAADRTHVGADRSPRLDISVPRPANER